MAYEISSIVSLHKYFIWANKMRTEFDKILPHFRQDMDWYETGAIEMNLYLSYWYGGLYVVIEGWRSLGLSDPKIDALLTSPNVKLLKRYRNGVFHFQMKYFDERFVGFMRDGANCAEWVRSLNRTFGGFFMNWLKTHNADGSVKIQNSRKASPSPG